jgi:hypothetical protein
MEQCTGYLGYPFQYMCADDELYPNLFLFIHLTSKDFHIARSQLILERISQVASTEGPCLLGSTKQPHKALPDETLPLRDLLVFVDDDTAKVDKHDPC